MKTKGKIRNWGQLIKAEGTKQKTRCLPYTKGGKKSSAVLNSFPQIVELFSFIYLFWLLDINSKSLETQICMQQINPWHFLFINMLTY